MALHNSILKCIQDGKLPEEFTISDLKNSPCENERYFVGDETYALTTINTTLANLSIDAVGVRRGKHVEYGAKPRYVRVSRGKYRLYCTEQQLKAAIIAEEEIEKTKNIEQIQFDITVIEKAQTVAEYVASYLSKMPFQFYFKKQKIKHPQNPAVGLAERLDAYFWPDLTQGWLQTEKKLSHLVVKFKMLELNKNQADCAEKLLALFAEICRWGGVRLPSIDAEQLKSQVFSVLQAIDRGEIPSSSFRLNSAFTKLYAMARPDSFIIFDSRVAAALTSIIDDHYCTLTSQPDWIHYQSLGFVNGRGGSRPRLLVNDWQNGYQKWSAQFAANKLCLDILAFINENQEKYGLDRAMTLRELEAILFMEGY